MLVIWLDCDGGVVRRAAGSDRFISARHRVFFINLLFYVVIIIIIL